MGEALDAKKLQYAELVAEAKKGGWKATVRPIEVGCEGFVGQCPDSSRTWESEARPEVPWAQSVKHPRWRAPI